MSLNNSNLLYLPLLYTGSSGDGLVGIVLRFGEDSGEYLFAGFLLRFSTWFPLGML